MKYKASRPPGGWGHSAAVPLAWLALAAVVCVSVSIAIALIAPIGTFNAYEKQAQEPQHTQKRKTPRKKRARQQTTALRSEALDAVSITKSKSDAQMIAGLQNGTIKINRFA